MIWRLIVSEALNDSQLDGSNASRRIQKWEWRCKQKSRTLSGREWRSLCVMPGSARLNACSMGLHSFFPMWGSPRGRLSPTSGCVKFWSEGPLDFQRRRASRLHWLPSVGPFRAPSHHSSLQHLWLPVLTGSWSPESCDGSAVVRIPARRLGLCAAWIPTSESQSLLWPLLSHLSRCGSWEETQLPSELGPATRRLLWSTVSTLGVAIVENVRWQLAPLHGLTKPWFVPDVGCVDSVRGDCGCWGCCVAEFSAS